MIYNSGALLPLLVGLATSSISGRVTLTWARSGGFHAIDAQRHIVWSGIGALAFPAQLALIVEAFFILWWPLAIVLVVACLIAFGLTVTRNTLAPLTAAQPALNSTTILAAAVAGWLLIK